MYSILCQKQGINWLVWLILYNSRYPLCLIGFKIELTGKVLFDNICWPNPTELKWHLIDNAWGGKGCKGTYIIVPASRGPSIFLDKPRRASARRVHYTIENWSKTAFHSLPQMINSHRLCPFVLSTSQTQLSVFSYSCPKFQCLYIIQVVM